MFAALDFKVDVELISLLMLHLHQLLQEVRLEKRLRHLEVEGGVGDMELLRQVGAAGLSSQENPEGVVHP